MVCAIMSSIHEKMSGEPDKKYKQMFEKSFYMCYTVWKNKEMDILYPVDYKEKQYDSAKEIKRIYKNPGSQ